MKDSRKLRQLPLLPSAENSLPPFSPIFWSTQLCICEIRVIRFYSQIYYAEVLSVYFDHTFSLSRQTSSERKWNAHWRDLFTLSYFLVDLWSHLSVCLVWMSTALYVEVCVLMDMAEYMLNWSHARMSVAYPNRITYLQNHSRIYVNCDWNLHLTWLVPFPIPFFRASNTYST